LIFESQQEDTNMAIWDFRPRGDVLTGVAVGVGVLAAPIVMPLAWSVVRPLVKSILKGGFLLYETGRGAIGEACQCIGIEEPKAETPVKIMKAEERTKATARKPQVMKHKSEGIGQAGDKEASAKPAHEKPKRQTKTAKKKPEAKRQT
jgi:hypothetical protein